MEFNQKPDHVVLILVLLLEKEEQEEESVFPKRYSGFIH